ncbi:hypothetical protein JQC92_15155 [Shewanella sp. 202IG2-18]|uniref:DUF6624 domain-containing protein n=1 Tax=Parashewanella hymeniacidonis TaxID=2807618 RepID=UPI0019613A6A|nr:DUF6624 domain-containing protein [Parashewanella hymeniacidonis]MBM7073352.1 hypothetical protein [Parashewanella hymeniacidonis]
MNIKFLLSLFLFTLTIFPKFSSSNEIPEFKSELLVLRKLDQKIRRDNTYWEDAKRMDLSNHKKLKQLIKKFGFPTIHKVGVDAHRAAFLITQHNPHDKSFFKYYINNMKSKLGTGAVIDKYYAFLVDRKNLLQGKKQIYGTQGKCVNGEWKTPDTENTLLLPLLRKDIGLPSIKELSDTICI